MKLVIATLAFLANLFSVRCFLFSNGNIKDWNGLKITFGSPNDTNSFLAMPRTVQDAVNQGWKRTVGCLEGFNGNRYILNNDNEVMLLFDANGLIAGISTTIKKGLPFNFPSQKVRIFLDDEGDSYTLSAYFVDPKKVCTKSLTGTWSWDGTGDRLVFYSKQALVQAPINENELSSFWTQGRCFKAMGVHYWASLSGKVTKDTDPDDFFPVFLLYNKGKLNAFGWAFNANLTSKRFEHPSETAFPLILKDVPDYLYDRKKSSVQSTLHIYLDNTPHLNAC